jgi:hypothetical protein
MNHDIAAQQAELKALADEVPALSGKLDLMQSAVAQATPQTVFQRDPPIMAAAPQRKKSPAPKAQGRSPSEAHRYRPSAGAPQADHDAEETALFDFRSGNAERSSSILS